VDWISQNGELKKSHDFSLGLENRAFAYGDGFFESILVLKSEIPLWDFHCSRISKAFALLQMQFDFDCKSLKNKLLALVDANNLQNENARLRLHFFRNNGGFYGPTQNSASFVASAQKHPKQAFELNEGGLKIGFAKSAIASNGLGIKSSSALPYVLAAIEKQAKQLDELIICNEKGEVAEAISSNIWWVKNDIVFTPFLESGCVAGVFRAFLIDHLQKQGIQVIQTAFAKQHILQAQELFLTNAVQGIQWVGQIDEFYFRSQFVHFLSDSLLLK